MTIPELHLVMFKKVWALLECSLLFSNGYIEITSFYLSLSSLVGCLGVNEVLSFLEAFEALFSFKEKKIKRLEMEKL